MTAKAFVAICFSKGFKVPAHNSHLKTPAFSKRFH
jgi:hypothetical protein